MKPLALTLTAGLLALSACAASAPSADAIRLAPPDAALTARCGDPQPIPAEADPAAQERLWRFDRINLANCRDKHAALSAWARGVVAALDAGPTDDST